MAWSLLTPRVVDRGTGQEPALFRLYRYVGPPGIARRVAGHPPGIAIHSPDALRRAGRRLADGRGPLIVTYVVDALGVLRVADRHSEHVACAGAGPVFAAGELTIDDDEVVSASNLSTGFCPEPSCWRAFAFALASVGIRGPDAFDYAHVFRRCEDCRARVVVKEGVFECAECGAALSASWNFDRTYASRLVVPLSTGGRVVVDAAVEAGGSDQDRVLATRRGDSIAVALADGAGGAGGGRDAAEAVVGLTRAPATDALLALRALDVELARRGGRTTAILTEVTPNPYGLDLSGASVGDSELWVRSESGPNARRWREATHAQRRKPLVGSGDAAVGRLAERDVSSLLFLSDGVTRYAAWTDVLSTVDAGGWDAPSGVIDLARLRSGRLQDDASVIRVRWCPSG